MTDLMRYGTIDMMGCEHILDHANWGPRRLGLVPVYAPS